MHGQRNRGERNVLQLLLKNGNMQIILFMRKWRSPRPCAIIRMVTMPDYLYRLLRNELKHTHTQRDREREREREGEGEKERERESCITVI